MAPIPDWRSFPVLVALADRAERNGAPINQAKIEFLWDYCHSKAPINAGALVLFMLAILPQEGTGSWNTSSENRAGDGGHGVEKDPRADVVKAVDLVTGKLALYTQACAQGFGAMARNVVSPGSGPDSQRADGGPDQWVNWATAVLRTSGRVFPGVVYAQHASWWIGVRRHFLDFGGRLDDLVEIARSLDRRAPRVNLAMAQVRDDLHWATNWNATAPEPAVVVTRATVTAPVTIYPPVRVVLPDGREIPGELRDSTTWAEIQPGLWVPVRLWVELAGAVVTWTPAEAGGPMVTISPPVEIPRFGRRGQFG